MAGFDGMTALITGAATGLGAATAIGLARQGARVTINYSSSGAEAEATANLCREAGGDVRIAQGNVADDVDCRRVAEIAAHDGRLDVLVNNAGITKIAAHSDLDALSAEDFHRLFAVNTIGPFQMIRAARPALEAAARARGHASSVVNVSSASVVNAAGSSIAYTASKAALNTMTLSLARALAPLIRVNAVCPGYMDTPWWVKGRGEAGAETMREQVLGVVPLQVVSTAEDIAEVVMFFAGPASRHVTGDIAMADAGIRFAGY
jgi:3-oxoacyl-[acyl-carrier protein] reductase